MLIHNGTWGLGTLPLSEKSLAAQWILREEIDHVGNVSYKARVVARGNEQKPGVAYEETFAPVVRWSRVRLIFALVAGHGWSIFQMGMAADFLNDTLKEAIFIDQSANFEVKGKEKLFSAASNP